MRANIVGQWILHAKEYGISKEVFAAVAAHSNFISVGLTQGFSAVMLPKLSVTDEESSWIASLGVISTPFGAIVGGLVADHFGRKTALFVPNTLFIVAWTILGLATHVPLLYLGRTLCGFAAGTVTPSYLYVSEIASKSQRGLLSALGPVFVSVGILQVYSLGSILGWQNSALTSTFVPVICSALLCFVPETPTWLVSQERTKDAIKSLQWLRKSSTCDAELKWITQEHERRQDGITIQNGTIMNSHIWEKGKKILQYFSKPELYTPFFIIIMFFFFQVSSGIYVILFYSVQIFQQFGTSYDENVITIVVGVLRLVLSILGAFLMLKFGRRPLSLFSASAMCVSLFLASMYLLAQPLLGDGYSIVPIICIFLHVGFSMTGFLQIPWMLSGELFPSHCRGIFGGITCSIAYFFTFVSVKTYPTLLSLVEIQGVIWIFFCATVIGVIFLYAFLPETKDKTLDEISKGFAKSKSDDRFHTLP